MSKSLEDLMDLTGKKAMVTGASGHIGPVVAQTLLEMGCEVGITDRDAYKTQVKARELGIKHWMSSDLTQEKEMAACFRFMSDKLLGMDIVVHCAALTGTGPGIRSGWSVPFSQQSAEAYLYSLRINLLAPFIFAQEFEQEKYYSDNPGVMVLFGSIYGSVAPDPSLYMGIEGAIPGPAGYSAAKGGVEQLTRHLAAFLAPKIRVNCLVPGGLLRGQPEEFIKRYESRTPLGRMGHECDLRGATAFLCSDLSEYVTGQVLHVDGGWGIW